MLSLKPSLSWEREIKVRHHFLRDHVKKGDIEMKYIDTERQLADIFIKPLDATHFASLWGELGVCHPYGMVCGGACVLSYIFYILLPFFCISFMFTQVNYASLIIQVYI
jgi:hypothetical protein